MLWMLVIYYLSGQTGSDLNAFLPFLQKWFPFIKGFNWGHLVAYFVLSLTFYWALANESAGLKGLKLKVIVVILSLMYGITDEYHQKFVEGRLPDIRDLINDFMGAALAMLFLTIPSVKRVCSKWVFSKKY